MVLPQSNLPKLNEIGSLGTRLGGHDDLDCFKIAFIQVCFLNPTLIYFTSSKLHTKLLFAYGKIIPADGKIIPASGRCIPA
jgi:hypothetical protein